MRRIVFCILIFVSCSKQKQASDPLVFTPDKYYSSWEPLKKSKIICSKYCAPLMPKNINEKNLSLGEIIDIALINNPNTKKSWADAKTAAALYGQTLSSYFPELNATGTWQKIRESDHQDFPENYQNQDVSYNQTFINPEMSISYTLFDFGKRKFSSEAARQGLFYANWTHNREIQTMIQHVVEDYYDYQYQKGALSALKADLENAKASLDAADQKFSAGIASVGDVVQAKSYYLQTDINLIDQKNNLQIAFAVLANDMGIPADGFFETENMPDRFEFKPVLTNVQTLVLKAQKHRQDFLATQAQYRSYAANLKQAKSEPLPVFDGEFDIGKRYFNNHVKEDYHYQAVLKLSIPLFKGFYYKNGIRNAKAKLYKAKADLEKKELMIIKDITTAHSTVRTSYDILERSIQYLESAKTQFDISLQSYKAGTVTILDLISSQSTLADARAKKIEAVKNWFISLAELAYATGTFCMPKGDLCLSDF